MQLTIYSWDGHLINDTTNYVSWFPRGMKKMPSAFPLWAARSRTFPLLANKNLDGGMLTFAIECKGTFHSQAEELRKWFAVDDYTPRQLIVKDAADSNRQWYVEGFPTEPVLEQEGGISVFMVTLALSEPLWKTVTGQSVAWSITASGQTKALSVLGNHNARPKFTITPTSGKTGGYAYAKSLPWYNPRETAASNSEPLEITNGGLDTAALVADNSNKCQINQGGGISNSVTTIPYDTVTGTIPSSGLVYCGTEQISYTGKTGTTSGNLTGCVRGVNGTTAATHADNAVIFVSKLMANGNDLRVFMDGVEVERWITGINTATTKIWINHASGRAPYLTLNTTIASSGAVTSIGVTHPYAYQGAKYVEFELRLLPASFIFAIGTEIFTASGVNLSTSTITVTGRAAKNTSMAAHAIGDAVTWIEHDIYLVYGNPSASAPTSNDARKPIFDLTSSTNTSWVYSEFWESTNLRGGAWKPSYTLRTLLSGCYTGSHGASASPATEAGITLNAWGAPVWRSPYSTFTTAYLKWVLSHPATITTVTIAGAKYRYTSDWPVFQVVTPNGVLFTESTPSAAQTWESLSSHTGVSVPSVGGQYAKSVEFVLTSGSVSAVANNLAAMEIQSATIAFDSNKVMKFLTVIAENTNFYMDSTIANSTTGESFSLSLPMELNKILVIDCDAETIVYDGKDAGAPIRWNTVRGPWLDIVPGANTLTFTDTGTTPGLSIQIDWSDKNTL